MDPACRGLMDVRRTHKKRQSMVAESMKTDAQLRARFEDAETADVLAHLASCDGCHAFDEKHRCRVCGLATHEAVGGDLCESSWHRFRERRGWLPKPEKPKAAKAPKPTPAEPDSPPTPAAKDMPRPAPAPEPVAAAPTPARVAPIATPAPAPARPRAAPKPKPLGKPAPKATVRPVARASKAAPKAAAKPAAPEPPRVIHVEAPAPEPKPVVAKPHDILGISPDATMSEIRRAFREKAKSYHPDRVAHLAPEFKEVAEKYMSELNQAYDAMRKRAKALES